MSVCALTSLDVNKFASTVFAAPPPSRPSSVRQHQVSSISFGNNDDARIEAYRSHQRVEPTTFRPEVRPNRAEAAAVEESLAWSRCLDCCFLYRSACRTTERTTTDHRSCLDRNRHADFLRAANTATEVQWTLQWTRSSSRALLSGRKPAPAPAVQSASDTYVIFGSPTKVRARSPDLRFGGVVRVAAAARRLGPAPVPSPQGRAMGGQVAAKPPLAARAEAVTVAAARPPLPLNLSEGIGKDPEAADAAGLMPDHRKVPSTQSRAVMPTQHRG